MGYSYVLNVAIFGKRKEKINRMTHFSNVMLNTKTGEWCFYFNEYCSLCKNMTFHIRISDSLFITSSICTEHSWADEEDIKKAYEGQREEWRRRNQSYINLKEDWLRKYGGHRYV